MVVNLEKRLDDEYLLLTSAPCLRLDDTLVDVDLGLLDRDRGSDRTGFVVSALSDALNTRSCNDRRIAQWRDAFEFERISRDTTLGSSLRTLVSFAISPSHLRFPTSQVPIGHSESDRQR
jgi:hypothetical protein